MGGFRSRPLGTVSLIKDHAEDSCGPFLFMPDTDVTPRALIRPVGGCAHLSSHYQDSENSLVISPSARVSDVRLMHSCCPSFCFGQDLHGSLPWKTVHLIVSKIATVK